MRGTVECRYMKGKEGMIRIEVQVGKLGNGWFHRVEDARRGVTNSNDTSKWS